LWVFTCTTATFFIVGRRTRAMVCRVLGEHFDNWLMSDGYAAYRDVDQRLRCLAHTADLRAHYAPLLNESFDACRLAAESAHEPMRALARELLNDWNTFWVVLD
jgi:hypothetical protein